MQGAGNDFIMINNMEEKIALENLPEIARHLCRRALSIGADGLIAADHPEGNADIKMRFYNSDGSAGEMCGNGVRCLARYAYENKLAGEKMTIETPAGLIHAERLSGRQYRTDLNEAEKKIAFHMIMIEGTEYEVAYLELGNPGLPHAVVRINGLEEYDREKLRYLGRTIRYHELFSKGTNVNFYDMIDIDKIKLLTYERGVEDFTLACGTGSGATVLTAKSRNDICGNSVELEVPGGILRVDMAETPDHPEHVKLYLTGMTNIVAIGSVNDEDLKFT